MTRQPPPEKARPLSRVEKALLIVVGGGAGFLLAALALNPVVAAPSWLARFGAMPVVAAGIAYTALRRRGPRE